MSLYGLSFLQMLGLLGGSLGFLGVMYLLRRPPQVSTISSILLWERVLERRKKRAPDYVRRLVSWLLVSAIAALALLGLADPEFEWLRPGRRRLQIVIDSRPPMLAVDSAGVSRWQAALDRVKQLLEVESPSSQVWLDVTAGGIDPSRAMPPREALLRLETLNISFSSDFAFPAPPPDLDKLLFLSSGERGEAVPPQAELISVYSPSENVSIESLDVQVSTIPTATIQVANLSQRSHEVRVAVSDSAGHVEADQVTIEPGQVARLTTRLEGFVAGPIVASLAGWRDSLALDDARFEWLPPVRQKILLGGRENSSLRTLLAQFSNLDFDFVGQTEELGLSDVDAVILSNWAPQEALAVPVLVLGTPEASWLPPISNHFSGIEEILWDPLHPLTRGLNLGGLRVTRAGNVEPGSARILGQSRNRSLLVVNEGANPWAQLTFRPEDSNLERHPAFPILVANFLKWGLERGLGRVQLGEIELPSGSRVWDPSGTELGMTAGLERDRVKLSRAGIYSAITPSGRRQIIANAEPVTLPAAPFQPGLEKSSPTESRGFGWWRLLVGVAFLLGVSEWALYHRRITV